MDRIQDIQFILKGDFCRISKFGDYHCSWDLDAEGTLKAKQHHHRKLLAGTLISSMRGY